MAFDIRIASEAAYFRAAGINNGLTASELGISYLLPRVVGAGRAFDIMLSGRDVDAPEAVPDALEVTARTNSGVIMAVRHRQFPVCGVQFHPESILTEYGKDLLRNFLAMEPAAV